MILLFHKDYKKSYQKLPTALQFKTDQTLQSFLNDPQAPHLKNHPLNGPLQGRRSISVTGDLRIVFEVEGKYITVLLLDVGTHSQLYG